MLSAGASWFTGAPSPLSIRKYGSFFDFLIPSSYTISFISMSTPLRVFLAFCIADWDIWIWSPLAVENPQNPGGTDDCTISKPERFSSLAIVSPTLCGKLISFKQEVTPLFCVALHDILISGCKCRFTCLSSPSHKPNNSSISLTVAFAFSKASEDTDTCFPLAVLKPSKPEIVPFVTDVTLPYSLVT